MNWPFFCSLCEGEGERDERFLGVRYFKSHHCFRPRQSLTIQYYENRPLQETDAVHRFHYVAFERGYYIWRTIAWRCSDKQQKNEFEPKIVFVLFIFVEKNKQKGLDIGC